MGRKEVLFFMLLAFAILSSNNVFAIPDTEISSTLMKVTLNAGERATKTLKLESTQGGEFSLNVVGTTGARLKEKTLFAKANEEKNAEIIFDSAGKSPGVYIGVIEIIGPVDALNVPVIFEVESEDVFFDINIDIPPVYTEITPGSKIVYQAKIFDLTAGGGLQEGLGPVTVDVEYIVSGLDGNLLLTRSEQQIVDKQSQITNTISFPEEVKKGTYVLSAVAKYKSSVGVSSQIFEIKEQKSDGLGINLSNYTILIVVGFGLLLFFGILFLFVYLLHERDKILIELRKYNAQEIRQVRGLLKEQQEILRKRSTVGETIPKREVIDSIVKKEVNEKITRLKKKQDERVQQIKKLGGQGFGADEMKRKIEQWKKQGYNISPAEYKIKELSAKEMREILKRWKNKYKAPKKVTPPKSIKRKKNSNR